MRSLLYTTFKKASLVALFSIFTILPESLTAAPKARDFRDYYELEPITVTGQEIPITVFARNGSDRRYATKFAHKVVEVAYETLEGTPGPGLVIIGRSGETHPINLFEKFTEKAHAPGSNPELKKIAEELERSFEKWKEKLNFNPDEEQEDEDMPIDPRTLIDAFPMPLTPVAAQLYVMAWEDEFDPERFDLRLSELKVDDLQKQDFQDFKWVFYLPPRNSFNAVLKEVLPLAFEEGNLGPIKRVLARGAIATFKPIIKDAFEGLRKGVLYWSILNENEERFHPGDVEALGAVYIESQMPKGKLIGGDKQGRAIEAVKKQKLVNEEYAKDPFVAPEPLENYQITDFEDFVGTYGDEGHANRVFFIESDSLLWRKGDRDPIEFFPTAEGNFVTADKSATIEFSKADNSETYQVELRQVRARHTFFYKGEPEFENEA
ncbi:hypothetical protein [Pelagicoccus albus]|uniref:Uncharacterized protein n=1 Tax=Pelagicoccus albus TaxID=415222 RepID=A0A7X1E7P5_9BACT|nr:hypothetical protein [Pelagicoccus albus]MBC2605358.1 hypothetical protein [Pelagicoccus albus]